MVLLSLFSGSLFVLPVAVTGGLYVGLQHQKVINTVQGKPPNINPDGTPRVVNTTAYCQKAYGIDPYPFRYTCTSSKGGTRAIPCFQDFHATTWKQLVSFGSWQFPRALAAQAYQRSVWDRTHGYSDHRCFPCATPDSVELNWARSRAGCAIHNIGKAMRLAAQSLLLRRCGYS